MTTENWRDKLDSVRNQAWDSLCNPPADGLNHPGLGTLATISQTGPKARNVVLRHADIELATVDIYTDNETPKTHEITMDNRVAFTQWSSTGQLQIRLNGTAEILAFPTTDTVWATLPSASKSNYGVAPVPGSFIAAPDAFTRIADKDRFAIIRITVDQMDVVHLGEPFHIRALFERRDDWRGAWLAP